MMKPVRRSRDKKKFGKQSSVRRSKGVTVKIKPKEEEPCRTRNPQPKIRPRPGADSASPPPIVSQRESIAAKN